MDIQEAIEHARQVAVGCDAQNRYCAYQHDKLADWLTALKQIAEIFNCDPNDPAQLKQLCDKLQGWQQADQDGQLVVLPCKVGDTIYFPVVDRFDSAEVDHFEIFKDKVMFAWAQYDRSYESTELWNMDEVDCAEVGKTVFLTRQEAEAAVRRESDT